MSSNEVAVAGAGGSSDYAITRLEKGQVEELIAANIGRQGLNPFMLERVKLPAGGTTAWEVPGLNGNEYKKELDGIVIHIRDLRAYWHKELGDTGGAPNTPPDCISDDSLVGSGKRWEGDELGQHDCLTCPLSQFGSDPKGGKGQACGARKALFMIRPDAVLPILIMLSPTSIKPAETYLLKLASHVVPFYTCVTRLSLEVKRNAAGQDYSRAVFSMVRKLTPEENERIRGLRTAIVPALDRTRISVADEPGSAG